jgi:hypothetical protein
VLVCVCVSAKRPKVTRVCVVYATVCVWCAECVLTAAAGCSRSTQASVKHWLHADTTAGGAAAAGCERRLRKGGTYCYCYC